MCTPILAMLLRLLAVLVLAAHPAITGKPTGLPRQANSQAKGLQFGNKGPSFPYPSTIDATQGRRYIVTFKNGAKPGIEEALLRNRGRKYVETRVDQDTFAIAFDVDTIPNAKRLAALLRQLRGEQTLE